MVRAALAAEFGVAEINFIPMKDGSVLEYGTPRSDVEKEQFMADLGASYALHWVRRGDKFIVDKDFTTEARKKALRQVWRSLIAAPVIVTLARLSCCNAPLQCLSLKTRDGKELPHTLHRRMQGQCAGDHTSRSPMVTITFGLLAGAP